MLLFQPVQTFVIIATIPYLCVVKDSKKIYSGVLLDKPSVQDILLLRLLILFWPCWFEIIWFKVGIGLALRKKTICIQLFIKLRDAKIHPSIPTPLVGNLACMRMKTHWSIIGPCYEMLPCTAVRFSLLKCTALVECSIIGGWLQEMDRSHQCLGTSNPCTCPRNYILRCWEVDAKLNQFMRKRKWNSRIEKQKKEVLSMKRWKGGSTQERGMSIGGIWSASQRGGDLSLYCISDDLAKEVNMLSFKYLFFIQYSFSLRQVRWRLFIIVKTLWASTSPSSSSSWLPKHLSVR